MGYRTHCFPVFLTRTTPDPGEFVVGLPRPEAHVITQSRATPRPSKTRGIREDLAVVSAGPVATRITVAAPSARSTMPRQEQESAL